MYKKSNAKGAAGLRLLVGSSLALLPPANATSVRVAGACGVGPALRDRPRHLRRRGLLCRLWRRFNDWRLDGLDRRGRLHVAVTGHAVAGADLLLLLRSLELPVRNIELMLHHTNAHRFSPLHVVGGTELY